MAPVAAPRAVVRDFSGGAVTHAISFDARTVYDFLISLMLGAGDDSDLLPEDAVWLKRSRATLDPAVLGDLDSCFGEKAKGVFHSLQRRADVVAQRFEPGAGAGFSGFDFA